MQRTTAKKVDAVVLCGALIAAIGTGTVFTANSMNSLQVKMENGVKRYSIEYGKHGTSYASAWLRRPGNKAYLKEIPITGTFDKKKYHDYFKGNYY